MDNQTELYIIADLIKDWDHDMMANVDLYRKTGSNSLLVEIKRSSL